MRRHLACAAVLAAACSTAPVQYYGVAPPGLDTAYKCAVAQLNIMGYRIEAATDGIVVTGSKRHHYWFPLPHGVRDVLTATSYDHPETGETNLRVTAWAAGTIESEDGPRESVDEPSGKGRADARTLLQKCGVGNVVGPTDGQ